MKVSINEALRLKKELAAIINKTYKFTETSAAAGETFQDDVIVSDQKIIPVDEALSILEQLLNISLELNEKIDKFNRTNDIPSKVREKKNTELKLNLTMLLMRKSKPTLTKSYEIVHDKKVVVTNEFKPFIRRKEFRQIIKEHKATIRKLQRVIDSANTDKISLSFDYNDLAKLEEIANSTSNRMVRGLYG